MFRIKFRKNCKPNFSRSVRPFRDRNGTAAVETAILLPLLVLFTFSSLELSNMVFLKQGLSIATYEGAKVASSPGTTDAQARARVQEILTARGFTSTTISISPALDTTTPRGTMVTIAVSSSDATAGVLSVRMFTPRTLQSQSSMVRQ